jgi:hypothetical protein
VGAVGLSLEPALLGTRSQENKIIKDFKILVVHKLLNLNETFKMVAPLGHLHFESLCAYLILKGGGYNF